MSQLEPVIILHYYTNVLLCFQKTLHNVRQGSHQSPQTAQQAGFGKFIVVVAPFVAAGGAITYAK